MQMICKIIMPLQALTDKSESELSIKYKYFYRGQKYQLDEKITYFSDS